MKLVLVGLFAVLFIYQFSTTDAAGVGSRTKRYFPQENCPEKLTEEECSKYATEKLIKDKSCTGAVVSGKTIEWQFCGLTGCTANGQELKLIEDLSKPYPGCCPKCDLTNIEPSDVTYYATL